MYYNFNSKKYIFLLLLICFIFTIFVIKAFDYLPQKEIKSIEKPKVNQITELKTNTATDKENDATIEKPIQNQKSGILYKSNNSLHDETKLEEIEPPAGAVNEELIQTYTDDKLIGEKENNSLSKDELALKAIIKARKLASQGINSEALEEYQKVVELTNDKELIAESYDGISELYAKNKRYSTAMSFAGNAYKSSPSLAREFFIAKIYYMAG